MENQNGKILIGPMQNYKLLLWKENHKQNKQKNILQIRGKYMQIIWTTKA